MNGYDFDLFFCVFQNLLIFNNRSHGGFGNNLVIRTEIKDLMQDICEFRAGIGREITTGRM